jgi:hypothetical protein
MLLMFHQNILFPSSGLKYKCRGSRWFRKGQEMDHAWGFASQGHEMRKVDGAKFGLIG